MACPIHICSAKHINMYGGRTMSTRTCSGCWPRNRKMEDEGNCWKTVLEMMGRTIPRKYDWKCFLDPVLMAFRGHFTTIDVHKTLRGLKKTIARCFWNCWFRQGPRAPVSSGLWDHFQWILAKWHCVSLNVCCESGVDTAELPGKYMV